METLVSATGGMSVELETSCSKDSRNASVQADLGFVVIGRNEGQRLKRCLQSILRRYSNIVYVDSGSCDGSVEYARSTGVEVVDLDRSSPFSAARARNAGFQRLLSSWPALQYIQFMDGDCELATGWMAAALEFLASRPEYAAVAGRRIERYPELSVYNKLCDFEWNTPVGDAAAVGGDFVIRAQAFRSVSGFNPVVVAGEEPELCYRLKKDGWKIRRIVQIMTIHDARMKRFSQWWKRTSRAGHAYIHGFVLHKGDHAGYYRKQTMYTWLWSVGLPIMVLAGWFIVGPAALLPFLLYPVQTLRIAILERKRCAGIRNALIYAAYTMLAKWPQLTGQLRFLTRRMLGKSITIIEHK